MFVNNFKNILHRSMGGYNTNSASIKLINGNYATSSERFRIELLNSSNASQVNLYTSKPSEITSTNTYGLYQYSMVFGKGNTPPTPDDYWLADAYNGTDHFNFKHISLVASVNAYTLTLIGTIENKTSEDLVVSELGIISGTSNTSASQPRFLIARKLITPVTIAPNETKTFQYTMDFSEIIS